MMLPEQRTCEFCKEIKKWPCSKQGNALECQNFFRFLGSKDVTRPDDSQKVQSDGGSTSYYRLPDHATELRHLISHKDMSKSRGDIFKACYRLGEKEGADILYDLNKMKFFIEDLIEMHKRGERL